MGGHDAKVIALITYVVKESICKRIRDTRQYSLNRGATRSTPFVPFNERLREGVCGNYSKNDSNMIDRRALTNYVLQVK